MSFLLPNSFFFFLWCGRGQFESQGRYGVRVDACPKFVQKGKQQEQDKGKFRGRCLRKVVRIGRNRYKVFNASF